MDATSVFIWIEESWLSVWVRESPSIALGFPGILVLHTIGMGFVAGGNAAVALRMLGFVPGVQMSQMLKFYPYMWAGFWVNAISGVLLLIGYPTKALTNLDFYLKLSLIALGVVNMRYIGNKILQNPGVDTQPMSTKGKIFACASFVLWFGAIASGRFLAYTYTTLLSS